MLATAPIASTPVVAQDATLALRSGAREPVVFWRAGEAPRQWTAPHPALALSLEWERTASPGAEWAELSLQGSGEARFTRLVLVRLDPASVRLSLDHRTTDGRAAWDIGQAPARAVVALNAGQFTGALPWGWLVQSGSERLAPGRGPLSSAFVVRTDGGIEWVDGDGLQAHRARHDIALAFQSYPAILTGDGDVPWLLHTDAVSGTIARPAREADIDRTHRDARLALGVDRQGRVLIALTRFDGFGGLLDRLPLGLTVPEMAALMGALGARQAMLLDGGISAQLLVRTPAGEQRFSGSRRVPLGLVVTARR